MYKNVVTITPPEQNFVIAVDLNCHHLALNVAIPTLVGQCFVDSVDQS